MKERDGEVAKGKTEMKQESYSRLPRPSDYFREPRVGTSPLSHVNDAVVAARLPWAGYSKVVIEKGHTLRSGSRSCIVLGHLAR